MAKKLTFSDIPPDTIIVCPKCKTTNVPAQQNCRNCREDLRSVKLDILNKLSKMPNDEAQELVACRFCGSSNPRWAISCHYCANFLKRSRWQRRTVENLRERNLASVIASLVLGGVSFALGVWQNDELRMTIGFGFAGLAFLLFLRLHWVYASKGKDSAEAPPGPAKSHPIVQPMLTGKERPAIRLRRRSMIVVEVGICLVLFGIGSVVGAFLIGNYTHSATVTIPGGHYTYFHTNSQVAYGHLSVSYSVSSGDVSLYVFTSDQFQSFSTTGFAESIYQGEGSSGSFSVNLPGVGTYYLVIDHSRVPSLLLTTQNLNLTYSLSGIAFEYLISGIGVLAAGIVSIVEGRLIRKKVRRSVSATIHESASSFP